ncbi:hypothetical protein ABZ497_36045, partial [Kitasatospora sp. NPDC005751]
MRYTAIGRRTGPRVSEYALGTANFGTGWGAGAEPDEARRIFDRFAEAGGTFLTPRTPSTATVLTVMRLQLLGCGLVACSGWSGLGVGVG